MEVVFKIADEKDIPGIIELCDECFDESTELDYALKVFNETKDDLNQIYLNGEVNGNIIAHTKLTIIPTIYQPMSTYAIVNHFCVKPEYRRRHIAFKMLDESVKICQEKGCSSIKLWSKNVRVPAHSLYHEYGFELLEAGFFEKEI